MNYGTLRRHRSINRKHMSGKMVLRLGQRKMGLNLLEEHGCQRSCRNANVSSESGLNKWFKPLVALKAHEYQ